MEQTNNPFGDAIYCYTRKQAIMEGVLVDLSQTDAGRQHWKYPVACTAAVWTIVESALNRQGQDLEGILHDLFTMAKIAARRVREGERNVLFMVIVAGTRHQLRLTVGPGDTAEPVLTMMLPNED